MQNKFSFFKKPLDREIINDKGESILFMLFILITLSSFIIYYLKSRELLIIKEKKYFDEILCIKKRNTLLGLHILEIEKMNSKIKIAKEVSTLSPEPTLRNIAKATLETIKAIQIYNIFSFYKNSFNDLKRCKINTKAIFSPYLKLERNKFDEVLPMKKEWKNFFHTREFGIMAKYNIENKNLQIETQKIIYE